MKFTLPKSKLNASLQSILQVVPTKSTLPILTNILVEALEGKLKLSATDLDISITATVECNVIKKGSVALPARILFEIIRELPEAEVSFEAVGNRVEMKIPNGSYKIAAISPEDFPKLPAVNTKKEIRIDGADLVKMVRKTTFACSTDETRPALNGVLWQTKGDKMQMVATDGHRLAKMAVSNSKLKGMAEDVIIPPKVLNLIPKFLDAGQGDVGIIFGDNNIIFNLGDVVLTSRLIEGPYPNFEQVIPANSDKKLTVSKEDLASAVRRVSILSNALTHQVRFSLRKGSLTLATSNADVGGEGREALDCDFQGEPLELGYNATYITDILSRTDSAEVVFELSTPVAAGIVYSPDVPKEDFLCLVMPLRLAD
ncbi:DNA polymerase III subunit beta [candidate division GN15 bacterium]|uniref:Beta sliding clamp n=1 Tax=candidate division GN15 bacterium TaxID=2072418 RepID=A0A855WV33_9BACT|nr:MAG: DNA polymerase III subunit beta [candidate division GN15 bacterium]